MTLTKDQKRDLGKLSEYFKKIEKVAIQNNIDLDVFMTIYRDDGYSDYTTETIGSPHASKRKGIFENAGKEKSRDTSKRS